MSTTAFTPWQPVQRPPRRFGSLLALLAAHVAVLGLLWQGSRWPAHALLAPVLSVRLLLEAPSAETTTAPALPATPPALPAPPEARTRPVPAGPVALPPLRRSAEEPAATPAAFADDAPAAPSPSQATESTPAAVSAPAPTPPPAAPAPRRQVAYGAVRYLVLPPVEVPRAARRAGEHGTVWLRVVVSAEGLPLQVSVHRSSGFNRLDEQALWAMRQARFRASTEDGRAVEVEVIAPIEYPLD